MQQAPFRMGDWLIRPAANEIVREGKVQRVEPRVMEMLVVLAAREGKAVSRDDLLKQVWAEVVVSEDALNATVSKLRRALNDDARHPHYVETIPRRGYRLVAPVDWCPETSDQAEGPISNSTSPSG